MWITLHFVYIQSLFLTRYDRPDLILSYLILLDMTDLMRDVEAEVVAAAVEAQKQGVT